MWVLELNSGLLEKQPVFLIARAISPAQGGIILKVIVCVLVRICQISLASTCREELQSGVHECSWQYPLTIQTEKASGCLLVSSEWQIKRLIAIQQNSI